ncbi:MAG: hypothetical protein AAB583_06670, partial [Patescibacteria group bacterium]
FRYTVGYQFSVILFGLGFLAIIKDPQKQGWHDKTVGSKVIVEKSKWPLALFVLLFLLISNLYILYSAISVAFSGPLPEEFKTLINSFQAKQKSQEKMPSGISPKNNEFDTSSWQTYRNDEFGFEVKYPGNWISRAYWPGRQEHLSAEQRSTVISFAQNPEELVKEEGINIFVIPKDMTSWELYLRAEGVVCENKQILVENIQNLIKSNEIINYCLAEKKFYFSTSGEIFKFGTVLESKTFDQILSTFRFVEKRPLIPTNKISCEAKEGVWDRFGLVQEWRCNLPTSDAGQQCSNSSQCESICVVDGTLPPGTETKGKCYAWTETLGTCLNHVNKGKAQGTLCVD